MSSLLYIFGQPGAGKSTLVRELVKGQPAVQYREAGLKLIGYPEAGVIEIGDEREAFRGTDALGMSAITQAVPFVEQEHDGADLLAEGDRLAVDRFLKAAEGTYDLELVYLKVPNEVAAARRERRGSNQKESWVKGRITKAEKLAERWRHLWIDATIPVEDQALILKHYTKVGAKFRDD